jgi:hypothetical protein
VSARDAFGGAAIGETDATGCYRAWASRGAGSGGVGTRPGKSRLRALNDGISIAHANAMPTMVHKTT